VTLLGRRDDIADLLDAADLALLTSTWEARALVAQEALLSGLPLVSTRVGGIEELVGDAAWLIGLGDVGAGVRAVSTLAADPQLRRRLAQRGLERAGSWPDEDAVAEDVLAAYREVLQARGR
jgi:glycosyltransferase involved in cell wall biosynthesis